ncbi:MAG: hypothetical protein K2Q01_10445 [Rickettsiales bacterium]|nr:hypothetical protein [Rickettsiales bacterium]
MGQGIGGRLTGKGGEGASVLGDLRWGGVANSADDILANPAISPLGNLDGDDFSNAANRIKTLRDKASAGKTAGGGGRLVAQPMEPGAAGQPFAQQAVLGTALVNPAFGPLAQKTPGASQGVVGDEGSFFKTADPLMNTVEKVATVAGIGQMVTDLAIPLASGAASKMGFKKTSEFIHKPVEYLNPKAKVEKGEMTLGGHINNVMMLGFAGISTYGVAKGFAQNVDSLKHMYSDMTGTPMDKISTMTLLTSNNVPEMVKQARKHLLAEHMSRGGLGLVNLGLVVRSILRKKSMGMVEFLVPMAAGFGIDFMMGNSVLPYYAGVANAHASGQAIPKEAYAEFLLEASADLKRRGPVGARVAGALGAEFAAENASPGAILKEIEATAKAHQQGQKGPMDARIDRALAAAEAAKKAKAEGKQAQEPVAAKGEKSMVERIGAGGKPRDIDVQGKFTGKLKQELTGADMGAGRVTVP